MKSLFQSKYTKIKLYKIIRDVFAHTYEELTTPEQINGTYCARRRINLGYKINIGK